MPDDAAQPLPRLADQPLFRGVPEPLLTRLLRSAQRQRCRDDEVIFARGDVADRAYIVVHGTVRLSVPGQSGKRVVIDVVRDPELFGEFAVIDGGMRTAEATALGPVELLVIHGAHFRGLIEESPRFASNLLRLLTARIRRTDVMLEDASLSSLEVRLAKQLLHMMELGHVRNERGVRLNARMRQDDLADLIGATTRSIINILNKWRDEGLAEFDGRSAQVTIRDLAGFQTLAGTAAQG